MIFKPLPKQSRSRPIVFITDAGPSLLEVSTAYGGSKRKRTATAIELLFHSLDSSAIYSLVKPKQLASCLGYDKWTIYKYHNRVTRLRYKNTIDIYPFSTFGANPQAVIPFFDALLDFGINPASMSTMCRNSWLRTLTEPLWIKEWGRENVGRRAFYGGRKETLTAPAKYSGARYLDLSAAYLQAMWAPIPLHLRLSDRSDTSMGIQNVIASVPRMPWGPLPFRIASGKRGCNFQCYGHGKARGYFLTDELSLAQEVGADIESLTSWGLYQPKPIFNNWLPWAFALRNELPTEESRLAAKMFTTRLWSMFAINPEAYKREVITFGDAKGRERHTVESRGSGKTFGDATFISAIIATRVRTRLYRELLSNGAVYCDTDGGIVPDTVNIDGWRETRRMDTVEIRGAQAFRWECPKCGEYGGHPRWHYSVAGIPPDSQLCEALFQYAMPAMLWDLGPMSLTLPAGDIEEVKKTVARETKVIPAPLESESL